MVLYLLYGSGSIVLGRTFFFLFLSVSPLRNLFFRTGLLSFSFVFFFPFCTDKIYKMNPVGASPPVIKKMDNISLFDIYDI